MILVDCLQRSSLALMTINNLRLKRGPDSSENTSNVFNSTGVIVVLIYFIPLYSKRCEKQIYKNRSKCIGYPRTLSSGYVAFETSRSALKIFDKVKGSTPKIYKLVAPYTSLRYRWLCPEKFFNRTLIAIDACRENKKYLTEVLSATRNPLPFEKFRWLSAPSFPTIFPSQSRFD